MARISIKVALNIDELVYDFENKAFLTGRSRKDVMSVENIASVQASDSEEDRNQALRSIQNAYASLLSALSEYISVDATTGSDVDNTLLGDDEELSYALSMPANWNQAGKNALATVSHQYIVNRALADWFIITNKVDAQEYMTFAGANLDEIRNILSRRVRPTYGS